MMRNLAHLLTLLLLLLFCLHAKAQDTLLTVNGTERVVKLVQITPKVLFYHQPPSDSALQQLPLAEVFLIKFGNGEKQAFPEHLDKTPAARTYTPEQLRTLARRDVTKYGKLTNTAVATGIISVLYLPVGLIMAAGTGKPRTIYANEVSDKALLQEKAYVTEYKAEMQRRKRAARFTGVAVGAGVWLSIMLAAGATAN